MDLTHVGKKMDADGIAETAKLLIGKYWHLKIEEFEAVLDMGIMGEFGPLYDVFDTPTVFNWFGKYERLEKHSAYFEKANGKHKEKEMSGRSDSILEMPEYRERMKAIVTPKSEEPMPEKLTPEDFKAKEGEVQKTKEVTPAIDPIINAPSPVRGNGSIDFDRMVVFLTEKVEKGVKISESELEWLQDHKASIVDNKIVWQL
jgi:hypothetical protein